MENKNYLNICIMTGHNTRTAEAGLVTAVEYNNKIAVASRTSCEVGTLTFDACNFDWVLRLAENSLPALMKELGADKSDGITVYISNFGWEDAGFIFDAFKARPGIYSAATGKEFGDKPFMDVKVACPMLDLVNAADEELRRVTADPDADSETETAEPSAVQVPCMPAAGMDFVIRTVTPAGK